MNEIFLIGNVGSDITLDSVINKVKDSDNKKPLAVHIHSPGGSVYEGLAIYNYLKGLEQEVNTLSSGLVASIASVMFLAGKQRTINNTDNFLIHLPSAMSAGNAKDLEKTAKALRDIEDKLSDIYENETSITKDEALELMKNNEFLKVDFLQEKGFVNEVIEFKAVAILDENKENMSEQLTKKEALSWFEKIENLLKPKNTSEEQAPDNKIVQDANGVDVDFVNLSASDNIKIGDEAKIDNAKASGDITMPNGEVWKFENGILNEIVEVKEESELEKVTALLEGQNELVATLETEKLDLTNKLTEKETEIETMTNEVTELKNKVTSNFDHNDKVDNPTEKEGELKSRSTFKSKLK